MYYTLYTLVGGCIITLALPIILLHALFTGRGFKGLRQRFGFFGEEIAALHHKNRIWFHAASVGEVQVAKALIHQLKKNNIPADLILSTVTEQGHIVATSQLGDEVLCIYAPIDLPWVADTFIRTLRPSLYVCLETELWPNILKQLSKSDIRALLLNGRMTERSFRRYRKFKGFLSQVLHCFTQISTIQASDAEKYISLGAEHHRVLISGNAKYDLQLDLAHSSIDQSALNPISGTGKNKPSGPLPGIKYEQPLLVAGSTHSGEEDMLAAVYKGLKSEIPGIVLILAPRHLHRLEAIEQLLNTLELKHRRLSQLSEQCPDTEVILVDSMGALIRLYPLATYVFCGGSLINRGGHNVMEPAACGKSPFYGPYMNDFQDARTLLETQEAGYTVNSCEELAERIIFFSRNPELLKKSGQRALTVATSQSGAAGMQAELIINNLH